MKKTNVIALLISSALPVAAAITYVDATASNTTLADGSAYTPTASTINDDNEWSLRTVFGNNGTVYTTNDSNANPGEDGPMLRTTIGGLAIGSVYDIYVYFWGAGNDNPGGNQRWDIEAGLTTTTLTFYDTQNGTNLGHASTGVTPATYFTNSSPDVLVIEGDRRLYQAHLGTATADGSGNIHVFIDDAPGNANRTWYDGVGYEVIPEPGVALLGALGLLGLLRRRRN
jgi:hypothetical protein